MTKSTLSFTVRLAADMSDLRKACEVRSAGYGHHVPGWRSTLVEPDALDRHPATAVLLCEDKRSGEAVGTARLQTSRGGPLMIERSVELPERIARQARAEVTRLSAVQGSDPLVKIALWKAAYLYCQATQSRWMVIGARNEALVRQYQRLGFENILPDGAQVPLVHAGGLPHSVLAMNTFAAERAWFERRHGLYDFVFETFHEDIRLVEHVPSFESMSALAA